MRLLQGRLIGFLKIFGLFLFVLHIPVFIGEALFLFERPVANLEKVVAEERSKLGISDDVKIAIQVRPHPLSILKQAETRWLRGDSKNIRILFFRAATVSLVRHEFYHVRRVSRHDINPRNPFVKWKEEYLAHIYSITGVAL